MNIFDRKINFDALLKFSHITPLTQQHLKKVYAGFALCMFVAAAGAYVHVVTHFLQAGLLSALGSLGLMIWLMTTPHSHETEQKRLGLLAGFAFLTGVGLGPALELCIAINPNILPTAFMGTAMIFTYFTLSTLYARRRSYLFLGGVLMSAMSLMLLSSLGNVFFGSIWLFQAKCTSPFERAIFQVLSSQMWLFVLYGPCRSGACYHLIYGSCWIKMMQSFRGRKAYFKSWGKELCPLGKSTG
ncbi:bax inhibitor 1-like [Zalophus californianus]|uniref:Bax inhibitor 1 n=1 Tax=Zalophus californianus TaxID=9704 RepID=A0A6J2CTS6_ZALCA|nr:bax inhibitor 1-like [Zalophus californianus]